MELAGAAVTGDDAQSFMSPDSNCASSSLNADSELYSLDLPRRLFGLLRLAQLA